MKNYELGSAGFEKIKVGFSWIFWVSNTLPHTLQPVSFKIQDNGPPGSVIKILKNQASRLLKNALATIKSMPK